MIADVPLAFVTRTSTVPTTPAGEFAVIVVELTTTTLVAAFAPNATVDPEMNPVPVIVTLVPPPEGPEFGFTALTVGAAR